MKLLRAHKPVKKTLYVNPLRQSEIAFFNSQSPVCWLIHMKSCVGFGENKVKWTCS